MRDLIRQIVSSYLSLKLEGQEEGYVVFSGQEADTKQPVLVKILPRVLGPDPQIAARFRALAQTIRQLNHPNIATVRDVGERAGLPYLAVRAIERAQPLADRLDQPWAVDEAADIVMQAGQALEHAYGKGLVHGDLSPKHILVQPDGRVAVTDFGLAQMLELVGIQLTEAREPFRAPERAGGKPPTPRADVYSLAAVLYALLARRPPQIVQGQVLPPSRFNADVPQTLDAVVVKGLAPNPDDRYPDVKAFVASLGAVALVPAARPQPVTAAGRCPRCGTENPGGRFCRKCGARLQPAVAVSAAGAAGTPQPARTEPRAKPSPAKPEPKAKPSPARPEPKARPGPSRPTPTPPPATAAQRPRAADVPIQITTIEVGSVEIGKGIEVRPTVIATPITVASGELAALFPPPLDMPNVDTAPLAGALHEAGGVKMPEPPPMPVIDWAAMVPPPPEVPVYEAPPPAPEGG